MNDTAINVIKSLAYDPGQRVLDCRAPGANLAEYMFAFPPKYAQGWFAWIKQDTVEELIRNRVLVPATNPAQVATWKSYALADVLPDEVQLIVVQMRLAT